MLSNHSYFSENRLRRKRKYLVHGNNSLNCSNIHACAEIKRTYLDSFNDNLTFGIISHCESVVTSSLQTCKKMKQNSSGIHENKLYKNFIEMLQTFKCQCCGSFLFENQLKIITKSTDMLHIAKLFVEDHVCNYCYEKLHKNELPCISLHGNNLYPGIIPECLKHLSFMEKNAYQQNSCFYDCCNFTWRAVCRKRHGN